MSRVTYRARQIKGGSSACSKQQPSSLSQRSGDVFGAMPTFGAVPAFGGSGGATFGAEQIAEPSPQFLRVEGAGNSMVDGIYTLAGTHKNVNKWYE